MQGAPAHVEGRDSRQCIQACRVTGLVSGWVDETTTVTRIMDVAAPGRTVRGRERRLPQSLRRRRIGVDVDVLDADPSTERMVVSRPDVRVRGKDAEARREGWRSREPGTVRRGRIRGGDVPSTGADLLDALLRESRGDAIGSRRQDPRAALAEHERDADHGDAHDHGHREDLDEAKSRRSPKRRAKRRPVHRTSVADAARVGDRVHRPSHCKSYGLKRRLAGHRDVDQAIAVEVERPSAGVRPHLPRVLADGGPELAGGRRHPRPVVGSDRRRAEQQGHLIAASCRRRRGGGR